MAGNEPFKSTSYNVDRIVRAITADIDGNLIFADTPNPDGVTLSELVRGLVASNVTFDSSGTFFDGVTSVQEALEKLNTQAYVNNTGRFLYVDPTIDNSRTVAGEIYNDLKNAADYANTLIINGYNSVNIMVMGSHKQSSEDVSTDMGVYEYDGDLDSITVTGDGIKFIGVGSPVIRLKNLTGTRQNLFVIGDADTQALSVGMQDIHFEFEDSVNVSAINVFNAPGNVMHNGRSGFHTDGITYSYNGGTNSNNRVVDVTNTTSAKPSDVSINGLTVGTFQNLTQSTNPIEPVYVDHNAETVVRIDDVVLSGANKPNRPNNNDDTLITSFTAITALSGKVLVNNVKLDEKFFWNGVAFPNVFTRLFDIKDTAEVTASNISIVRDSFNASNENKGGITSLSDWIDVEATASLNIQNSVDEVFTVDIAGIDTGTPSPSSAPGSGSPAPSGNPPNIIDVKPVKGFYNKEDIILGLGDKNELRLGQVPSSDAAEFITYSIENYGIPFWVDEDTKELKYFNGTNIVTLGSSGPATSSETLKVISGQWTGATYNFAGKPQYSGFEYTFEHNLNLPDKYSFTVTVHNDTESRQITPEDVIAIDNNSCKIIILDNSDDMWVTVIG